MVYKTRKRYRWNAYQYKVSAETAGSVMEQIERERGSVDKESFLEASRPEDSPTHDLFEWDDSIITDMSEQLTQRLLLMNNGIISRAEMRQWYFGETES